MNKLLLILALAASAYGSALTATTTCSPFSGPTVVVNGPGECAGGSFQLIADTTRFKAIFDLLPGAYAAGGCEHPMEVVGCGLTEIAVNFNDDLSFNQTGFATFYLDRDSNIPGDPFGQPPFGTIAGQPWNHSIIQVAVGAGQPVHIGFSADWMGQCCAGGPDSGSIILTISKIVLSDENGNPTTGQYDTASGLTYPVIGGVLVPEPASVLLCALGFGILAVLRRRLASA